MDDKVYLDSNSVTLDSFALARKIHDSGFRPDVIIALWRGGTPVGIAVHEFFHYKGVECYHTAVKTSAYTGIGQCREPEVENMDHVLARIEAGSKVLVVDDIFDTGETIRVVREKLAVTQAEIRVATLYCRSRCNTEGRAPDFFLRVVDSWLVFPHELMGLTPEEVRRKGPEIYDLLGL
ncbi:MAG: phosphoribosyltransferase [Kiritimatiellia bacterium]|jgi:hypoxanthine phosphoribosyltransferase|uniref:phosphoribosyltransferase n=1 Tax=Atribacter sp. TaxID=2847780 RepID=UPI003D96E9AF